MVDGGAELFGDATILPDGRRAYHGYEALAIHDQREFGGNGDGKITRQDRVWSLLRLWVDRNHDGLMSQDENTTLAGENIIELSLASTRLERDEDFGLDANGVYHLIQGSYMQRVRGQLRERVLHELYFPAELH
jgi:hypothetical protein